ncbi:MAG: isoprenylcysteine carboxylmethyltransferase family protein [Planctomycetes bacterium]|nr:isoprenylcysteine carboxylmethyltransferase family protein [Planctomycetota bacterium]MCB9902827.1 isoprenylcysteine carboxylmethyltransferase family protein [Planctomycetota bacterium]
MTSSPSALSRGFSFAYGLGTYGLFLGTFLYVMFFVLGWFVPTTLAGGREASLTEALLVNGGFLALFAVQHTIMARTAFKRWWTKIIPAQLERSTFVLITCAILLGMVWQWRAMPGTVWAVEGTLAHVLTGIALVGWAVVLLSTFLIDHFDLFGVRQVVRYFRGLPAERPRFVERVFYKHVRHPLMTGFLIAFWAAPVMSVGQLFFAVMCTGYILFGLQVEERTLVGEHGQSYRDYQRRVPMLIPLGRRSS